MVRNNSLDGESAPSKKTDHLVKVSTKVSGNWRVRIPTTFLVSFAGAHVFP